MATETLTEYISTRLASGSVDRTAGVVRGVKLLGLESKNGRRYLPDAVKRAAPLYEGARANVNHPKGKASSPRDYQDRLGAFENIASKDGGLYGDLKYNPKHPVIEQFLWDCENNSTVGFSHNVVAETSQKNGETLIESIVLVQGVDLVADPATTKSVFEHTDSLTIEGAKMEWATVTADDLKKNCQPIVEQLIRESNTDQSKDAEIKQLKEQLDAHQVKEKVAAKKATIAKLIAEAKLPTEAVTDIFTESLESAADEARIKSLIEDRAALVKANPGKPAVKPVSKSSGEGITEGFSGAKSWKC